LRALRYYNIIANSSTQQSSRNLTCKIPES